jgi:hypothetical protein
VEEVVIRKQIDNMKAKGSEGQVEVISETNVNQPAFQLEFGNLTLELISKEKDKSSKQHSASEEEDDVDLDDEASASMRQILASELGRYIK